MDMMPKILSIEKKNNFLWVFAWAIIQNFRITMNKSVSISKARGCLVGAVIGDCIGAFYEGVNCSEQLHKVLQDVKHKISCQAQSTFFSEATYDKWHVYWMLLNGLKRKSCNNMFEYMLYHRCHVLLPTKILFISLHFTKPGFRKRYDTTYDFF